ncbi:MAG TPA: putative Ig domain-containing protein [Bacteroidota bacterium]|nr:putative Ig domain-containing protein [Bacteroidota bacterium]
MKLKPIIFCYLIINFLIFIPILYSQQKEPTNTKYILTPEPSKKPRINGASIFGVRPGSPFLYRIPVTGEKPIKLEVKNLPDGLSLNKSTGIITGKITKKGEYKLIFVAKNKYGKHTKNFKVVCGDKIGLTPQMGWNHWYMWVDKVNDKIIREAADAMIYTGLADHGYSYINIDDSWSVKKGSDNPMLNGEPRDSNGYINSNKNFPDMKALTDYIHSKGLKAGIYSSPGPLTCGNYIASYGYEEQDSKRFFEWGFDLLKYDLCSYRKLTDYHNADTLKKIYKLMGYYLQLLPRDIIYNLCEYGEGKVWEWGNEVYANSWRTAYDLGGKIDSIFHKVYRDGFDLYAKYELHKYAKPGNWNDPDYLLLGIINNWKGDPIFTPLTPDEQYSYFSFWVLINAPLIISSDITRLDEFTLRLLTNDEVIEVNQDELGKAARRLSYIDGIDIWYKELYDGSLAVGLFNRCENEKEATLSFSELGSNKKYKIRDLWRQKDLGIFKNSFTTKINPHGVVLIKLTKK